MSARLIVARLIVASAVLGITFGYPLGLAIGTDAISWGAAVALAVAFMVALTVRCWPVRPASDGGTAQ